MVNKVRIRKILRESKKNLLVDQAIQSPVFYIKGGRSKDEEFVYHFTWENKDEKALKMNMLRIFCETVKAREVIMVSDTFIHHEENGKEKSEALCVSLETHDQMELVLLPYIRDVKGKIVFEKELWERRTEKYRDGYCEGLVQ